MYYIATALQYTLFMDETNAYIFDNIKIVSYIIAAIVIFLGFKIKKHNSGRYFSFVIFVGLLLFATIVFDEKTYFPTILFGLALPSNYFEKYIKKCYYVLIALYMITIVSSQTGLIDDIRINNDTLSNVGFARGIRSSLGFEYYGQVMISLMTIVILDYYIHRNNSSQKVRNVFWTLISTLIFSYSKTIAPYIIILLYIISFNILKRRIKTQKPIKHKKNYIVYICCALTIISEILYKRGIQFMYTIDYAVNGRLSTTARVINRVGIKLLGTTFENSVYRGNYQYLDSDYFLILVKNGVILFIILMIIYNKCVNWSREHNLRYLELTYSIIAIYSMIDNGMFSLYFNPFIILMPGIILNREKLVEENLDNNRRKIKIKFRQENTARVFSK